MSDLNDNNVEINTDLSTTVNVTNITKEEPDEIKYAVLMETSGEECESWYYCIRYNGNEQNLKHLNEQLETVDWYILDDLSTFDLDLEHLISEKTAKELTKLELNHYSFHRKFNGILDKVDLKLRKKDKNEKKMVKVFEILGYGQIEDFIDNEDLDEEDLTDTMSSSSEDKSESEQESSEESDHKSKKYNKVPPSLHKTDIPRFASIKQRGKYRNKKNKD